MSQVEGQFRNQHMMRLLLASLAEITSTPALLPDNSCYIYKIAAQGPEDKERYQETHWVAEDIEHAIEQFRDEISHADLKIISINVHGIHHFEAED